MLSTDLSTFAMVLAGFSTIIALVCAGFAARGWAYCQQVEEFIHEGNERSVALRELAELQAGLTELHDAYKALYDSHKKLRSRIGMREVREKRQNSEGNGNAAPEIPDPQTDPEGWKRAMRVRLHAGTLK